MSKTAYQAWSPDYDETRTDARRIDATDPESAAEEWLENANDEGSHTDGDAVLVYVRAPDGDVTRWAVRASLHVSYSADEVSL